MHLLIGIDDTDVKESRGTGYKSRILGEKIMESHLGHVYGISRHQLLIDPRIPYTSQNSAACLEVFADDFEEIRNFCREYLINESEEGSDAALCIIESASVSEKVISWGQHAKEKVLTKENAIKLADTEGIYLEGFKGTHEGIIGALAATGLRAGGNDGRIIWLKGKKNLRELKGIYLISELKNIIPVDGVIRKNGDDVNHNEKVKLGDWIRPVIINNRILIIAEEVANNESYEWESAHKDFVRSVS